MPSPRFAPGLTIASATAFTVLALALATAAVATAFDDGPGRAFLGTMSALLMPLAGLVLLAGVRVHVGHGAWARRACLAVRVALAVLVIAHPLRHAVLSALGAAPPTGAWLALPSTLVIGSALALVLASHKSRAPLAAGVLAAACALAHGAFARVAPGSFAEAASLWLALVLYAGAFAGALAVALAPDARASVTRARVASEP